MIDNETRQKWRRELSGLMLEATRKAFQLETEFWGPVKCTDEDEYEYEVHRIAQHLQCEVVKELDALGDTIARRRGVEL